MSKKRSCRTCPSIPTPTHPLTDSQAVHKGMADLVEQICKRPRTTAVCSRRHGGLIALALIKTPSRLTCTTARTSGSEFCVGGTGGRRQKR